MPRPNFILSDVGFWDRCVLPTPAALKVLKHLAEPGEARLYVHEGLRGGTRYGLSHSEHSMGWSPRTDHRPLKMSEYIKLDKEVTETCIRGTQAFRITDKGREAIVQSEAYLEYREILKREVPKMLERLRLQYGVALDKKG